jgi:hypothetical protein
MAPQPLINWQTPVGRRLRFCALHITSPGTSHRNHRQPPHRNRTTSSPFFDEYDFPLVSPDRPSRGLRNPGKVVFLDLEISLSWIGAQSGRCPPTSRRFGPSFSQQSICPYSSVRDDMRDTLHKFRSRHHQLRSMRSLIKIWTPIIERPRPTFPKSGYSPPILQSRVRKTSIRTPRSI